MAKKESKTKLKKTNKKKINIKKDKTVIAVLISFIILTLIILIVTGVIPVGTNKGAFSKYAVLYNSSELMEHQKSIDENIITSSELQGNTMKEPMVIVNPYGTSPLSAIIVFNTPEETNITANLLSNSGNSLLTFKSENKTEHIIPVYGLYMGRDNKIELKDSNGNTEEVIIPIEKKEYHPGVFADAKVNDNTLGDDDFIFLYSKESRMPLAYDQAGDLRWFLDYNSNKKVLYLENGNILISDASSSIGTSETLMEVDLLGKVHKIYELEKPYFDNIVMLPNNNILYGSVDNTIVEYDLTEGKFITSYNIPDLFKKIDTELTIDGNITAVDYDQSSGLILAGIQYGNTLLAFDKTGEVKWIFSNPENYSDKFTSHLLKPVNESTTYPGGSVNSKLNGGILRLINKNERGFITSFNDYVIDSGNKTIRQNWNYINFNPRYYLGDYALSGNERLLLLSNNSYGIDGNLDATIVVLENETPRFKMNVANTYDYIEKRPFVKDGYEFEITEVKEYKVNKPISKYTKLKYKDSYKQAKNYGIAFTLSGNTLLAHYHAEDYAVVLMEANYNAYRYEPDNGVVNFEIKDKDLLILIEHEGNIYNTGYYITP